MSETNGHRPKRLTGKQATFVHKYLGQARFNATLAAQMAGYRATSKHSFQAIGSENLTKPEIRKTIDEYFKISRMSAEEVITELSVLARGDSKDKLRALALLSSHYGLLDGSGAAGGKYGPREPVQLTVRYETEIASAIDQVYGVTHTNEERADRVLELLDYPRQVEDYNTKLQKHNDKIRTIYDELMERYKDSPDAIAALTELRTRAQDSELSPEWSEPEAETEPIEPEIIPPDRRLRPAAVERLMNEVKDTDDAPQASPVVYAANGARNVTPSMRFCNRVEGDELAELHEKIERGRGLRMY